MRIEHIALWTRDAAALERLRDFYVAHFGAVAGGRYESARRPGFVSYFVSFPSGGARIELMTAPGLTALPAGEALGWAHIALALGSRRAVDDLVAQLRTAGVSVESGPRLTGDGYYEAVIRDPEGNVVEIMTEP